MVRFLIFLGLLLSASLPWEKHSTSAPYKKIFIGVDGVSREQFDYAREKLGLFQNLTFVKTHVSTFPSISDYSWNVMVGSRKIHGRRGRIRNYEAAHFDRDRNELVSDPREYFRRLGDDELYFTGAFKHWLNPYVEALLYIPTEELPKLELRQLRESILSDPSDLVTVMVASSDALAHTRENGNDFLLELDRFISELDSHYAEKKIPVEIILVSDHGQASRFLPGEKSLPLKGVDLSPLIRRSNLQTASKISSPRDIVLPVMALSNYGSAFFQNEEARNRFSEELRKEKWFELGLFPLKKTSGEIELMIFGHAGEAILTVKKGIYFEYLYSPRKGNPLEIPTEYHGKWISDSEARSLGEGARFPDALYRIAFSSFEEEADLPDLLFTLKDDFYLAGNLNSFTTMYQTHGSLSKRSSFGILASTHPLKGPHPELRTEEILESAGLTPEDLFKSTRRAPQTAPKGFIGTGSENWDNRRIFSLMNRVVQDSRYVFDEKSLDAILGVVKPLLNHRSPELPDTKWKEVLSLSDVAHLVDILIKNGDIEKVKSDRRFLEIQSRLALHPEKSSRTPSAENAQWPSEDLVNKADAGKKLVMKSAQGMIFLEKAMSLPELPLIADQRKSPDKVHELPEIFAETFLERTLADRVFPETFPLNWAPVLPPPDVTLVYIPGIYNTLFDDEIFRQGLDRLRDRWAVRVISPQVYSTCSSEINGPLIMETLKKDYSDYASRTGKRTSYFILGYSKGGVDALHAFGTDPDFVSKNIHGLLTIASPIRGSSILNKSDLPIEVMQLLGREKAPAVCQTKEKASRNLLPATAQSFLRKKTPILAGLTRYYSLSFVSEMDSSHLFMRATKSIARFGEPNDGVVALSSSKFPDEFRATDLGVVNADHLSGIVASHFPQGAFFEAALFTLGRADAFSHERNKIFNLATAYALKNGSPDRHRSALKEYVSASVEEIFKKDSDVSGLGQKIQKIFSETIYALKPFSVYREKGHIYVDYREGRGLAFFNRSSQIVNSPDELYDLFLTHLQASGKNLLGPQRIAVPESLRNPASPPANELGYQEDLRLNLRKLDQFIGGKRVSPVTPFSHPMGISFVYDHASSSDFRNEYQMSFEESSPPDADDHPRSGWETVLQGDKVWAKLSSVNSSIRLTTYSWRFLARDFPELELEIQVNDDTEGANVLFGGSGKDDSAFQLWFTFRILDQENNREYLSSSDKMMTIGYYFGDEIRGMELELNQIYKNYYSEKDFVVARLPAARQKLIGLGKDMLGRPLLTRHNLLEDIRRSYPEIDPMKAEIVAITIQHDSNDTEGKSEALFGSFFLKPPLTKTVKAD